MQWNAVKTRVIFQDSNPHHSKAAFIDTSASLSTHIYTGSNKHESACISMAAIHTDTSSVQVRVTCEFHSYEQFLCRSRFLSNPYEVNNTKFVLILLIQTMMHIWRHKLCHHWIFHYLGCTVSKIINDVVEYCYFFRKAFTGFDFTGDCQQTRVELCACRSDRERSTRADEACTSDRQPVNGNPDSDS